MRPALPGVLLCLIAAVALRLALHNMADARVCAVLLFVGVAALSGAGAIFYEGARRNRFLHWLTVNRANVESAGAEYEGRRVCLTTELREYHVAFSVVSVSFLIPSRYFMVPDRSSMLAATYTALSAICGWWGFPAGPIYTVRALWSNTRGGRRLTVGHLYAQMDSAAAANMERERVKNRSFLSLEIPLIYKIAIGVALLLVFLMSYEYLRRP